MPPPNVQPSPATAPQSEARLRLLIDTGLLLASERSLDVMVQAALDAGLQLCGARFGVIFYNNLGEDGVSFPLYKLAGLDPSAFRSFPMPDVAEVFSVTHPSGGPHGILRSQDISAPPDSGLFAHRTPFRFMPPGLPPVRSYLAVPVCNRAGEVLGGLLFGHPDVGVFDAECEDLMATIASQTALAIDNFRLADTLTHEIALADRARALQRQTSDRLRQALDAAHLGTWVWDRETDRLDLDERAAQLFGVAPGESVTRTALRERIVLNEDLHQTTESLDRALASGGLYHAEYRVDVQGAPTWVSASGIATLLPGTTTIAGMVGTVQDISARKTQEATLRQSEKLAATGRLAATIAHEINNPLEAVTNLIYLCKTDPAVPAEARHLLETADTELVRVAQIAQQTLGFYRDTTRPVPIDINQLLEGIVSLFSRKLQYKKLHVQLDLAPNLTIHGLQGEVRQVFSNLVVNAIDASTSGSSNPRVEGAGLSAQALSPESPRLEPEPRVEGAGLQPRHGSPEKSGALAPEGTPAGILIRARHTRGGVTVLIADRGTGIPAAIRSRLFSPFFTTKQSVGTGLGLWVTRGIVEKQGGRIAYRSRTAPPTGTVFRVFLPHDPPPQPRNEPFPTQP